MSKVRHEFSPEHGKRLKEFGSDVIAGFTGAIASIPDALASGVIAGVSPVHGLYAYIFGTPIAALFSSSAFMCVTATSALSLLTKAGLATIPPDQTAQGLVLLVVMAGLIQLTFGLLRLGTLTYFVSNAVMTGFLTGISLLILMGTLPDLAGFESTAHRNIFKFVDLLTNLGKIKPTILLIGSLSIFSLLAFDRMKLEKISPILSLVIATLFVALVGWETIPLIGTTYEIPRSLPQLELPDLTLAKQLLIPSFSIAAIGLIQAAGVSQSTPNPSGSYPSISRDFTAQGLGNLASGVFQGLPIGGSLSATALMRGVGARSRWANVAVGVIMAASVIALAPLIRHLPLPAIDGLLFVFVARTLNFNRITSVWRTDTLSRIVMMFALIMTLLLPLEVAVLLSIAASFVLHIFRSSQKVTLVRLQVDQRGVFEEPAPSDLPSREITVLTVYGSLFFAGARVFEDRLPAPERSESPVVILSLRGREEVGSTFIGAITRYANRLRARHGELILNGVDENILNQLERTQAIDMIGRQNIFPASRHLGRSLMRAIQRAQSVLRSIAEDPQSAW